MNRANKKSPEREQGSIQQSWERPPEYEIFADCCKKEEKKKLDKELIQARIDDLPNIWRPLSRTIVSEHQNSEHTMTTVFRRRWEKIQMPNLRKEIHATEQHAAARKNTFKGESALVKFQMIASICSRLAFSWGHIRQHKEDTLVFVSVYRMLACMSLQFFVWLALHMYTLNTRGTIYALYMRIRYIFSDVIGYQKWPPQPQFPDIALNSVGYGKETRKGMPQLILNN